MHNLLKQKITPKQLRFIDYYLEDPCATKAARLAGYSTGCYGRQLIQKPFIQSAIRKRRKVIERQTNITTAGVIKELTELYGEAREKGDLGVATRCLELLGKHVGAFSADNTQKGNIVVVIQNFNHEEKVKSLPTGSEILDLEEDKQR